MHCPICSKKVFYINSLKLLNLVESSTYHCKNCGLFFRYPLPNANSVAKYYSSRYFRHADDIEKKMAEIQSLFIIDGLKKNLKIPDSINYLEFGAGRGWVLSFLQKSGFINSGVGYDPDSVSIQWGKEFLHVNLKKGFLCEDIVLEIVSQNPEINFISLIHVLEHLQSPCEIIKTFQQNFKNHFLFLEVPDADYEGYVLKIDTFPSSSMGQHFWSFSETSLRLLLEKNNYDVLLLEKDGNSHFWDSRIENIVLWMEFFNGRKKMFNQGEFNVKNICKSDVIFIINYLTMSLKNYYKKRYTRLDLPVIRILARKKNFINCD